MPDRLCPVALLASFVLTGCALPAEFDTLSHAAAVAIVVLMFVTPKASQTPAWLWVVLFVAACSSEPSPSTTDTIFHVLFGIVGFCAVTFCVGVIAGVVLVLSNRIGKPATVFDALDFWRRVVPKRKT